jgi:hypothetical protein
MNTDLRNLILTVAIDPGFLAALGPGMTGA